MTTLGKSARALGEVAREEAARQREIAAEAARVAAEAAAERKREQYAELDSWAIPLLNERFGGPYPWKIWAMIHESEGVYYDPWTWDEELREYEPLIHVRRTFKDMNAPEAGYNYVVRLTYSKRDRDTGYSYWAEASHDLQNVTQLGEALLKRDENRKKYGK